MDQDKRVLLAFTLSFGVLVLWRVLLVKPPPPPPKVPVAKAQPAPSQQSAGLAPATPVSFSARRGEKAQELVVEGELYRATLSSQGAVIQSWVLKKYRDEKGEPLDVINHAACEQLGFPMSVSLPDEALGARLNKELYVPDIQRKSSLNPPIKLEFIYSDGKLEARKQFSFTSGYEIHVEASVRDSQRELPVQVAWPGGFGDHSLPFRVRESVMQAVYGSVGNVTTLPQRKVKEDLQIPGTFEFAGLEDRYFVDILLPDSPGSSALHIGRRAWTPPDWKEKEPLKPLEVMLASSQPKPLGFRLFVAPKDLDVLRSEKPPLDSLVDFGWFSVVAKPLFLALRYIYDHWVHNYGWAIVILTVIINLLMFPLKLKSIRSAQEMQRIAPQVKGIQERYKQYKFNDPRKQRMNEEMMKLYREHGINPLGGCLPMILQLPFLYGFYRVLDLSIELRHAPWILWIKDLSMPDGFHLFGFPLPILPTVMIITMFILQKMTPVAATDPAQQRMMMVMPLIFGVMFYNFAAGLVLYWLTGNIVGIAQQVLINKIMPATQKLPVLQKAVSVKE